MKVKIFAKRATDELEKEVNEFLETLEIRNVIDIKYSSSNEFSEVMVIYK